MEQMLAQVKSNLENLGVRRDDRLLVAVSGGADSIALLHILSLLSHSYPFKLHVAHLNHSLRGKESDEDAEFVQKYSDSLHISGTVVKKDIASAAKGMKRSTQDAARLVRYQVLGEIAFKEECDWIATAHHADDLAETFLMRLIRGSGSRGLSAIPKKRGKIIRPFLHLTREEILEYLRKYKISYRDDSSNLLPVYFRNQIRHELLPLLKRYNPNIVKVLGNETEIFSEEEKYLEEQIQREMPGVAELPGPNRANLKIARFLKQPVPFQRGILRSLFFHLKGDLINLHFVHIGQIIHLAEKGLTGKSVHIPEGIIVYKLYDRLEFYRQEDLFPGKKFSYTLPIPGEIPSPELKMIFRATVRNGPFFEERKTDETWFDLDQVKLPLTVRTRQPGDLIYPARLKGKKKKLQDLFVDLKTSRLLRDQVPLLVDPDRVLWVMGMERDFKSLATPETRTVLSIQTIPLG
jgi:tRNA(Ile)-lysidine synthase